MKNEELRMNKVFKKAIQIILPLVLGVFILMWVYRDFDFSRVGDVVLHGMSWGWMGISLIFGVLSHVVRGLRWKLTLAPLNAYPKTSNAINAIFMAYAANIVLPRLGEVSRCGVLAKYDGISFSKSLGTVVTERLIDTICVILITALALFTQMKVFDEFFINTGTDLSAFIHLFTSMQFYVILICIIALVIVLYYVIRTLSVYDKIKGVLKNVWEGIISLRRVKNLPLFFLYTFLIWFFYFMQFYITFYCFQFTEHLGVLAGLVMFVGGSIAVVVPTPNGAGPWHFAVISMMMLYGVDETNAGIFALIVHGVQTFLVILLGIYALVALPILNKKRSL